MNRLRVAPEYVDGLVPGGPVKPGGRVIGYASNGPDLRGLEERILYHVLDEPEIVGTESPGQNGNHLSRFMTEKMIDQLVYVMTVQRMPLLLSRLKKLQAPNSKQLQKN
jgi:hypothetical protein